MEFQPKNTKNEAKETDPYFIYKFGSMLVFLAKRSNKSKQDIASELGVTTSTLSNWERGLSFPTEEQLGLMLATYGLSPSEDVQFRKTFETSFSLYKDSAKYKNQKLDRKIKEKAATDPNYWPASARSHGRS